MPAFPDYSPSVAFFLFSARSLVSRGGTAAGLAMLAPGGVMPTGEPTAIFKPRGPA